ncbi:MAG TPA: MBL fold metallo-hydrolase [Ruminococcus flavefaciens]|nr:MBL fold metallo-hydrolase [Ruminococcus flavefaciens]HQM00815.1 MBL fold metallo-hydrolase [Ruminococcus flavefaciens]
MRIVTLVENSCGNEYCIAEHRLSIYVETENHKLLLDTGQTDAVVRNAEALGVDLNSVDTVILSHGHYDHSGGILPFSKLNHTAQLIMQRSAAESHYNGERYIGIDTDILKLPNVRLIDGDIRLDDELFLFSGITGRRCYPQGN